jgi:alditol oxidase
MALDVHNWAGNLAYRAARLHRPESIDELQKLVTQCSKLRVLGSRHSFNEIADSTEDLVSLERFDQRIEVDRERQTVTCNAGMSYGQLGQQLHREGFAIHNLASLPHISVAGACATATHGSGDTNGNLATAVAAIELVTSSGDRVTLSRDKDGEQFQGAVVGLGGLGVVVRMTLDITPTFHVRQYVYENLPTVDLDVHFDAIVSSAYSVSLFTNWRGQKVNQVWVKQIVADGDTADAAPSWIEATLASANRHPLATMTAVNCTEQMGIPGPWHERLPHFKMEYTPSNGEELQSEYFVPRAYAVPALRAMEQIQEELAPQLMISEVRTVAADTLWMSMCYHQDSIGIHCTWKRDWPEVQKLLPLIEQQLAPFSPRPHWGKLFTMSPAFVQARYPRLAEFQELLRTYDPKGTFRNAFLDRYIFGEE